MNRSESKYFNTARRMDDALLTLLEQKDFDYITVREICQTAQVNRSTFYLHYETMTDLLEEAVQQTLRDFSLAFAPQQSSIRNHLADVPLSELNLLTDEYLQPYLQYLADHCKLVATLRRHARLTGMDSVYQYLYTHVFDPILARLAVDEAHRQYIIAFYLHGLIALIDHWIAEDCVMPIPALCQLMRDCVTGEITPLAGAMQGK